MGFFQLFSLLHRDRKVFRNRRPARAPNRRVIPQVEALENRLLLNANVISGFVFNDANNNGLFDPGEASIANNAIQLYDSTGALVGSTTTDANGFYQFTNDARISTAPATKSYSFSFSDMPTNWTRSQSIPQFDPSLGQLTSVQIVNQDPITSDIKVENMDSAAATITAQVQGTLTLNGPAVSSLVTDLQADQSFNAAPFDGVIDFAGPSGHDFGPQQAHGSNSITLSNPNDLTLYTGLGNVTFTEQAQGDSTVSGSANLVAQIHTTASSQVTIIYHYIPNNSLSPGNYTIVQPNDPPGFLDGQVTAGNVAPIPNSAGTNRIPVTLVANVPSTNNDFGELLPSSLSGFVYADTNDNSVKDPGEAGIPGATLTLTGTDDMGHAVNLAQTSAADGSYSFANLRPGTYTIAEGSVSGYLDGKDTIGSQGGSAAPHKFSNIVIGPGVTGVNNNFGELPPASLSGFVYADADNNGVKDTGEPGIAGAGLTLSGTDDLGNAVNLTQTSATDGSYSFGNLRPGSYTITEGGAAGYLDGKATIGSQGGTASPDKLSNIALNAGVSGMNNNFGELKPASLSGFVYLDSNNDGIKEANESGIAAIAVTLSGTDDRGNAVLVTQLTAADGSYNFTNLRPGTYTLTENGRANGAPDGYLDGKDTVGTLGGVTSHDQFSDIVATPGASGINYDFGELPPPPPPVQPVIVPPPIPSKQSFIFFFGAF